MGMKSQYWILAIFAFFIATLASSEVQVIKVPIFTHDDSAIPIEKLTVVKRFDLNFMQDFVAEIGDIVWAPNGNIFVYDTKQVKIFLLSKDVELMATFGQLGQGPGEFMQIGSYRSVFLNAGWDEKLYVNNYHGHIINVFSQSGRYLSSIKSEIKDLVPLAPSVAADGTVVMAGKNGVLEIFSPHKGKYAKKSIRLDERVSSVFLYLAPNETNLKMIQEFTDYYNYEHLSSGNLVIWLRNSGELMVYDKSQQLAGKSKIWPRKALMNYKTKLLSNELIVGRYDGFYPFGKLIGSRDLLDEYIISFPFYERSMNSLDVYTYVFDKQFRIKNIYKMPSAAFPLRYVKANNGFWGIDRSKTSIVLMKKEEE